MQVQKTPVMDVKGAYDIWADQYDTNQNKTRDLEAISLRETLNDIPFERCLEIGCGTGKNTIWLLDKAGHVKAVDLSPQMLEKAKEKIRSDKVEFLQADILQDWHFAGKVLFDLATFSLVLEHIQDLDLVFRKLGKAVRKGGYVYVGELHPFKQYAGSKARFETEEGLQVVTCFNHHITDFTGAADRSGFELVILKEYFDDQDRSGIPRLLTLLFRKK